MSVKPCDYCGKEFHPKTNERGRSMHMDSCGERPADIPKEPPKEKETQTPPLPTDEGEDEGKTAEVIENQPCPHGCGTTVFRPQPYCHNCAGALEWS